MSRSRHRRDLVLALIAALVLASSPAPAQTTLRLLAGWTTDNPQVPNIETTFIANVEQASKGEIKIIRSGPETVSPFEQLQPVSTGAFDILLTLPGYHLAQTGVGYLFDAIKGDIEERRQSALIDWADDYYNRRFGLRILTLHSVPGSHFVLREALRQSKPLDGLKVRTTPTFSEIVRLLGGSPVNISPAEAYSAMQTGELDGIALPAFASAEYKLYEVGKFMTRPLFGLGNVMLMMNAAKLASLPPKLRHVMVEEGSRFDQIGKDAFDRLAAQDQEIMLKNGVKTVNLEAAFALKINELYNEVIFHNANRASPHEVKTLWDLAKGRNLLNQ